MFGMSELAGAVIGWFGRAIKGSKSNPSVIHMAWISTAERLARLVNSGVADDISFVKQSLKRRINAETRSMEAEAALKLAKAAEESEKVNQTKLKLREAQVEKYAGSKAEAIKREQEKLIAKADARLIEAISKLKQEGGGLFFDQKNLKEIYDVLVLLDTPHDEKYKDQPESPK